MVWMDSLMGVSRFLAAGVSGRGFWGVIRQGSGVSMESGLGVEFCIKNATLTYILTYILLETPLETRMDIE
jgi:hypothetical protein